MSFHFRHEVDEPAVRSRLLAHYAQASTPSTPQPIIPSIRGILLLLLLLLLQSMAGLGNTDPPLLQTLSTHARKHGIAVRALCRHEPTHATDQC